MTEIKNVTIEFNCPEKLNEDLFCGKCAHSLVDFTNKTNYELIDEIKKTKGTVCGLFKKSQLSTQFLKYAAATFIVTSLTIPAIGQELINGDSLLKACEKIGAEKEEEVFLGMVIETQAEPIGGYKKFFEAIVTKINYPAALNEKGKSFVEFTVGTDGQMKDVRLIKGFNELADREAVRVLSTLHYPFNPGRQRGKPVQARLVIPITFDPKNRSKK